MITKTYIQSNLRFLNSRFLKSKTQKDALYASKLAILELCGWIEVSVDDLFQRVTTKRLLLQKNQNEFESNVLNRIYGFSYDKHFRKLLIHSFGLINIEKLEQKVDQTKRSRLETELTNLKSARNTLAHTYIKGVTQSIDAPSVTIARFPSIYEGLKEYESVIKSELSP